MMSIETTVFASPVGELILGSYAGQLCMCDWKYRTQRTQIDHRIRQYLKAEFIEGSNKILDQTLSQLKEYFEGSRTTFTIPILLLGTDFQKRVWDELLAISYGKTISYLTLSKQLNAESAIRAVASANGANAISILIPCHRVIGSDGQLVGYAGGLQAKRKLLELETGLLQTTLF